MDKKYELIVYPYKLFLNFLIFNLQYICILVGYIWQPKNYFLFNIYIYIYIYRICLVIILENSFIFPKKKNRKTYLVIKKNNCKKNKECLKITHYI